MFSTYFKNITCRTSKQGELGKVRTTRMSPAMDAETVRSVFINTSYVYSLTTF